METDSGFYYADLGSPTRDADKYLRNGGIPPQTLHFRDFVHYISHTTSSSYPYACDEGMVILGPPYDPNGGGMGFTSHSSDNSSERNSKNILNQITTSDDGATWILDYYGNHINAIGIYGTDDRNGYYVYSPPNTNANSPIVVLIHGGAWFSGPDPENINGWTLSWSDNAPTTNLVKQLMDNGYVVVSLLYRLAAYGKDNTEITANTVTWQEQINDIDAAIAHIYNNFPSCLGINANSIQVLGESAGGHLALMWAYTKTTLSTSIIKSVIACYPPTNLQEYGNYLRSKTGSPNLKYNCGTNYYFPFQLNQFPYYPFWFPIYEASTITVFNSSSSFSCQPYYKNVLNQSVLWSGYKVIDSTYNFIQTSAAEVITSPSSNSTLGTYSPKNALTSSRIIPTFIMHSPNGDDHLVPYNQATDGMSTALSSHGGLIATLTTNNADVNYNYGSLSDKHLIKQFPGADHGWGNTTSVVKDTIRGNIITWLNGHQ